MERDRCELLAPAGSKEAYIAAVESGADAIYVGGTLFNARMNAKNLDDDDLAEAIAFAHKRRVKTYVTVNTLIKDSELRRALDYCRRLSEMRADGLIIQDLGLGRLVRDNIPGMPIHLSTQGSVYDLRGVRAAAKLGYSRVVLERQLTMEEIREVCEGTDVEIEVFCHGALCFCYSGQCQLSMYIGGRSANRGECAQPCRMEYRSAGSGGRTESGFLLSPADSCMLEHVGELADAGVASLKIEGRMKSPEYVSEVVSIYRKRLDEYYASRPEDVNGAKSDLARLTQIYSRGFTDGFFRGSEDPGFMSGSTSKNRGVDVGRVEGLGMAGGSAAKSAGRSGGHLIRVEEFAEIAKGDGLEIRRKEPGRNEERPVASCLVTYLDGKAGAFPRRVTIGDVKPYYGETVRKGDRVCRISEKAQLDAAGLSYKNKDWHSGKFTRKTPVRLTVSVIPDSRVLLIRSDSPAKNWYFGPFEPASDITGRVAAAFGKTGGTPFDLAGIQIAGDVCLSIPMSRLNEIRREVFADIEEELAAQAVRNVPKDMRGGMPVLPEAQELRNPCLEVYFYDIKDMDSWLEGEGQGVITRCADAGVEVRALIPAVQLAERYEKKGGAPEPGIAVVPYIPANTLGKEEKLIAGNFDRICRAAGETGIYAGNLSSVELFAGTGVRVYADYGLNIYNEESVKACRELGAEAGCMSLEAADKDSGAYPLMVTRHRFGTDRFTDRKGARYRVVTPDHSGNSYIVPGAEPAWERAAEAALEAFSEGKKHRVYVVGM